MRVLDGFVKRLFCCDSAHVMLRLKRPFIRKAKTLICNASSAGSLWSSAHTRLLYEAQKDEDGNGRPDDLEEVVAVGIMQQSGPPGDDT